MSIRKLLLAASLVALLPLGAMAEGGPGGGHWHGRHDGDLGFLAGVQLTQQQRDQMHQLMHTGFEQMKPLMKQMHDLHRQMGDQLASAGSLDQGQLTGLQQQIDQLRGQIDQQRLETALQVRALLTPEQLAQAAQAHQQLQSLHTQMRNVLTPGQGGSSPQ
jgi:Spy/CpxP family protein refolding chaperone